MAASISPLVLMVGYIIDQSIGFPVNCCCIIHFVSYNEGSSEGLDKEQPGPAGGFVEE